MAAHRAYVNQSGNRCHGKFGNFCLIIPGGGALGPRRFFGVGFDGASSFPLSFEAEYNRGESNLCIWPTDLIHKTTGVCVLHGWKAKMLGRTKAATRNRKGDMLDTCSA